MTQASVLVDSSIWIDHINQGDTELSNLLSQRRVRLYAMIIAEVSLGSLANRETVLRRFSALPLASAATHAEVMAMIEWHKLWNQGVGYVDAHLLAATKQTDNCILWTRDKRLHAQAARLGVAYTA